MKINKIRLICIAQSFSSYDESVLFFQDKISVELIRYFFAVDEGLLCLEKVYPKETRKVISKHQKKSKNYLNSLMFSDENFKCENFKKLPSEIRKLFEDIETQTINLDKSIMKKVKKQYIAYTINGKNFVEFVFRKKKILVFLDIPYYQVKQYAITKDVSKIGHHGTGNTEITLSCKKDIEECMDIVRQSYEYRKYM